MLPTVLLYNFSEEKLSALKKLCLTHRLRARVVAPSLFGVELSQLLAIPPENSETDVKPAFSEEMLVFAGLAPGQLDAFLQGFRKAKLPQVPLKAILTPTNSTWNSIQLHNELTLEHNAMQAGKRAHSQP